MLNGYSQIQQNFGCDKHLCKLNKEYLNASPCKFVVYSIQHSKTFDVLRVFLPLTIAELSMLKQVQFFWSTLVCLWSTNAGGQQPVVCINSYDSWY